MKASAQATHQNKIVNVVDFSRFITKSYLVTNEPGYQGAEEVEPQRDLSDGVLDLKAAKRYLEEALSNNDININQLQPYLHNKDPVDLIKVIRFKLRQADIGQALGKYIQGSLRPDALKILLQFLEL